MTFASVSSSGNGTASLRRFKPIPWIVLVGLLVFVIAFFLPSLKTADSAVFPGWSCAWFTLGRSLSLHNAFDWFLFLSGCVNPALLFYFSLRVLNGPTILCRCLAIAIVVIFLPSAWIAIFYPFAQTGNSGQALGATLFVGHYFWVIGTLLVLSPELANLTRRRT